MQIVLTLTRVSACYPDNGQPKRVSLINLRQIENPDPKSESPPGGFLVCEKVSLNKFVSLFLLCYVKVQKAGI